MNKKGKIKKQGKQELINKMRINVRRLNNKEKKRVKNTLHSQ